MSDRVLRSASRAAAAAATAADDDDAAASCHATPASRAAPRRQTRRSASAGSAGVDDAPSLLPPTPFSPSEALADRQWSALGADIHFHPASGPGAAAEAAGTAPSQRLELVFHNSWRPSAAVALHFHDGRSVSRADRSLAVARAPRWPNHIVNHPPIYLYDHDVLDGDDQAPSDHEQEPPLEDEPETPLNRRRPSTTSPAFASVAQAAQHQPGRYLGAFLWAMALVYFALVILPVLALEAEYWMWELFTNPFPRYRFKPAHVGPGPVDLVQLYEDIADNIDAFIAIPKFIHPLAGHLPFNSSRSEYNLDLMDGTLQVLRAFHSTLASIPTRAIPDQVWSILERDLPTPSRPYDDPYDMDHHDLLLVLHASEILQETIEPFRHLVGHEWDHEFRSEVLSISLGLTAARWYGPQHNLTAPDLELMYDLEQMRRSLASGLAGVCWKWIRLTRRALEKWPALLLHMDRLIRVADILVEELHILKLTDQDDEDSWINSATSWASWLYSPPPKASRDLEEPPPPPDSIAGQAAKLRLMRSRCHKLLWAMDIAIGMAEKVMDKEHHIQTRALLALEGKRKAYIRDKYALRMAMDRIWGIRNCDFMRMTKPCGRPLHPEWNGTTDDSPWPTLTATTLPGSKQTACV